MYVGVVVVVALLVGVLVSLNGKARAHRWGRRAGPSVRTGTSPYREGVTTPLIPNAAPRRLRVVAGVNAFWGVITGLIFAPAGAVLALFGAGQLKLLVLPMLLVVFSGLGLAFALGFASARVLRRDDLQRVRSTLRWSMAHHAAVLVVMAFGSLMLDTAFLMGMAVIPCMLGMTFAHMLGQGVDQIELGAFDAYS